VEISRKAPMAFWVRPSVKRRALKVSGVIAFTYPFLRPVKAMSFCPVCHPIKRGEGPPGVNLAGLFWGLSGLFKVCRLKVVCSSI
jgi:hypothetical protein